MMRMEVQKMCSSKCRLVVEAIILILWMSALVSVNFLVEPRHQGFFCDDNSIKYPYVGNTVSGDVVVAVTLAVPVLLIILTELQRCNPCGSQFKGGNPASRIEEPGVWSLVGAYMTYFFGYVVLTMGVVLLKLTTGQLRPYFLAVCQPDVDLTTCRGYVSDYNCTKTDSDKKLLNDARQSFPSGHAAYAFYMALFMILYFELRLRMRHLHLLRLTLYALLTSYALWCSATRVSDHVHHVKDVVAGGLLGGLAAVATFFFGALPCLRPPSPTASDVESGGNDHASNRNVSTNNNNNNNGRATTTSHGHVDDGDSDSLENMETEAPGTPTPLLFNSVGNSSLNSAKRIGSSLRLVADKSQFRKFSLR